VSPELTPAELDAARVELFRLGGLAVAGDVRQLFRCYRVALWRLASAVNAQRAFPDLDHPEAGVREGLAMAAVLDADSPGRVGLAIWRVTSTPAGDDGQEIQRAILAELRAEKAADLARAERQASDAQTPDVRGFWADRAATLTDELARIDIALTPDSSVPSSLAGAA